MVARRACNWQPTSQAAKRISERADAGDGLGEADSRRVQARDEEKSEERSCGREQHCNGSYSAGAGANDRVDEAAKRSLQRFGVQQTRTGGSKRENGVMSGLAWLTSEAETREAGCLRR
jgi:hypothetical protein